MDNFYKDCPAKMSDGRFLADHRSTNVRDQYIKTINGIVRDDDYRKFLQDNAEKIMQKERKILKEQNSCKPKTCFHTRPTRITHGASYDEIKTYNAVKSGKLKSTDDGYPTCPQLEDYNMCVTKDTKF